MNIKSVCVTEDAQYELSNAILLYTRTTGLGYANQREFCFASIHDVDNKTDVPKIMQGMSVAKTAIIEALEQLVPEHRIQKELLPENVLAKGRDYLVWYAKPQKRCVWFKCKEFGDVSGPVDHPGLVFIVSKNQWYVFAINGDERPTADTPLFVAPYFNVWDGGHICIGNLDLPKGNMRFDTAAWEECFFRSYFTHPNVHTNGGLTKYRGGIFALWRALLKGRVFPQKSLVPYDQTLSVVFKRVVI